MDFVFDGQHTAVVGSVNLQVVGAMKLDVVAVALELGHQVSSPLNDAGPARKIVEDLVDDFVSEGVEEVITIDEVVQR